MTIVLAMDIMLALGLLGGVAWLIEVIDWRDGLAALRQKDRGTTTSEFEVEKTIATLNADFLTKVLGLATLLGLLLGGLQYFQTQAFEQDRSLAKEGAEIVVLLASAKNHDWVAGKSRFEIWRKMAVEAASPTALAYDKPVIDLLAKRIGTFPVDGNRFPRDAALQCEKEADGIEVLRTFSNLAAGLSDKQYQELSKPTFHGACAAKAQLFEGHASGLYLNFTYASGGDFRLADLDGLRGSHTHFAEWRDLTKIGSQADADIFDKGSQGSPVCDEILDSQFNGASMRGADLNDAILICADFSPLPWDQSKVTKLDGAQLAGASLKRAKLGGARLNGASLIDASLIDASLIGADLERADFTGANITRADFTGSVHQPASLASACVNSTETKGPNHPDDAPKGLSEDIVKALKPCVKKDA